MSFARTFSAQPGIPEGRLVQVETDVSRGLHAFSIVGLPDKAVEEARDRISSAIKHTNKDFTPPKSTNKKIVISLAPATLKKEGAVFDLPMALSYLLAAEEVEFDPKKILFAGELSLDGSLRKIRGALSIALVAREEDFDAIVVPMDNAPEAALVEGIEVYGANSLQDVINHLVSSKEKRLSQFKSDLSNSSDNAHGDALLDDIRGQDHAKRALEIAASGAHNIALYGPPGTGKTMLARALRSLLPPLTQEGIIQVTTIHSYAGISEAGPVTMPPFRSPHHTVSYAALIGGGSLPKPGEVTLAHRGILFLDEFPEFRGDCVSALREPLEDKIVSVSRVKSSQIFPANFILVAALNPCPCGFFGSRRCECPANAIEKYRRKISGPIADRIDMWVQVGEMPLESLATRKEHNKKETFAARERVKRARALQQNRFRSHRGMETNSDMGAKDIETLANITEPAEIQLRTAAKAMHLSPRGYHRTIKLARTIADLAISETIEPAHVLEALQYRSKDW